VPKMQGLVGGVVADLVLPYAKSEEPDLDRLQSELKVLHDSGVDGLCLGGVLGGMIGAEPAELSSVCTAVRKSWSKPLLVILFPDATPEGGEMVRAVDDAGADAILIGQPHYLAQPGVDGLEDMFAGFRSLTRRPLLVADCLPGSMLGVAPIRRLAEKRLVDGVLEAADMHVVVDLLCLRLDIPVYSCVEDLHYPAIVLGAHGIISNLASVFPRECVELWNAVRKNNQTRAREIHESLVRLWRAMSWGTEREARLRAAMSMRGRPVGAARSPYGRLSQHATQQIKSVLEKEGALA
jgi:4-hydroxy-tetrahydrodipicolinate synthase